MFSLQAASLRAFGAANPGSFQAIVDQLKMQQTYLWSLYMNNKQKWWFTTVNKLLKILNYYLWTKERERERRTRDWANNNFLVILLYEKTHETRNFHPLHPNFTQLILTKISLTLCMLFLPPSYCSRLTYYNQCWFVCVFSQILLLVKFFRHYYLARKFEVLKHLEGFKSS